MPKRPRQPGMIDSAVDEPITPIANREYSTPQKSSKAKTSTPRSNRKASPNVATPTPKQPKTKAMPKIEESRIKAGLDYGTTNSAVAIVKFPEQAASEVEVISSWPNGRRNNQRLEKVPSRFAFADENQGLDHDKWGYDIPAGSKVYAWTKLRLDDATKTKYDSPDLAGKLRNGLLDLPPGMEAQELATLYLEKVYKYAITVLEQRHGAGRLKLIPIDWWVTYPATWTQQAIRKTRVAAEDAAFGSRKGDTLNMITEPEAAAIAMLSKAADEMPDLVKAGLCALIADLGGGTLDYQILRVLKTRPIIETEEAVPGTAGKSGSTYLDCQFHKWMEVTFGPMFIKLPLSKTGHGSQFMNCWEVTKTNFDGTDLDKMHQIPLPALKAEIDKEYVSSSSYDKIDLCVLISGHDIAQFFDKVAEKAIELVEQQIVLLQEEDGSELNIICLCYGIAVHRKFKDGVDSESDLRICPVDGRRAIGYVAWFMVVGNVVHEDMRIELPVSEVLDEDSEDCEVEYELFSCPLNQHPERSDDPSVFKEGVIPLDLSPAHVDHKEQKTGDNFHNGHKKIKINIVAKWGDERGTMSIEGIHNRKVLGSATIDISQTHARSTRPRGAGAF